MRFLFFITVIFGCSALAEAAIVRVRSSAMLDRSIVRLEDVAEVYEDDPEVLAQLKAVTIEPAPIPGAQRRLSLDRITERLRAHGANLAAIEFTGRTVVLIGRRPDSGRQTTAVIPTSTVSTAEFVPAIQKTSKAVIQQVSAEDLIPAPPKNEFRALKLTPKELRDAEQLVHQLVKTHVAENAPSWGQPRITVHVPTNVVPKILDAPIGGLKLIEGTKLADKQFRLAIQITNDFGKIEVIEVSADIVRRPKVVVTTRALPMGHIVEESDIKLEEVDVAQREATELEQVLGKETKSLMRVGQRVAIDAVAEPKLVRRGDKIKGFVTVGTIRVMQEYKALQDGRLDDAIMLETILDPVTLRTEKPDRRTGRVVGLRQVEMIDAPEGSVRTGLKLTTAPN